MSRFLLASAVVGLGLACGALALAPDRASAQQAKGSRTGSSQDRDDGREDPVKRIDKAIESYESRANQDLDQTRKDIDRMRKELGDLVELQLDLAISLAELQAELRAQMVPVASESNDGDNSSSGQPSSNTIQERQRVRAMELARELRQVQDSLRNLVAQKRNETDQLVVQLRNLRAQQRQIESEREKSKQGTDPSKD
jgi:hypothetical protein